MRFHRLPLRGWLAAAVVPVVFGVLPAAEHDAPLPKPAVPALPAPPPAPPAPAPAVGGPMDEDAGAEPLLVGGRGMVKITVKRDGGEATIEVPADIFADDELKELIAKYMPKPDPNAVNLRVYSLHKLGIELPGDTVEKLMRKAARGPAEEQAEIKVVYDEANRLMLVSSWNSVELARVDLLMSALGKETDMDRPMFFVNPNQMPGGPGAQGGPGGPVWQGGPGGPGGPGGMRNQGQQPAQAGQPGQLGGGGQPEGADAELQKRMQLEKEMVKKRMQDKDKEKARDAKDRKDAAPDGVKPPAGRPEGKPENAPAGPDEQF